MGVLCDREPLRNAIVSTIREFSGECAFNDRWKELEEVVLANYFECDLSLIGHQRLASCLRSELKAFLIFESLE